MLTGLLSPTTGKDPPELLSHNFLWSFHPGELRGKTRLGLAMGLRDVDRSRLLAPGGLSAPEGTQSQQAAD